MGPGIPNVGSRWRHKSGAIYLVAAVTNLNAISAKSSAYPPTVAYVNETTGTWWSRPLAQWHQSMTEVTTQ